MRRAGARCAARGTAGSSTRGVEFTWRAERLRRLSVLQRQFDALPVDDTVAASYGRLASAVVEVGRRPRARSMDLLVAATAHARSARLYTRIASDFVGVDELVEIIAV